VSGRRVHALRVKVPWFRSAVLIDGIRFGAACKRSLVLGAFASTCYSFLIQHSPCAGSCGPLPTIFTASLDINLLPNMKLHRNNMSNISPLPNGLPGLTNTGKVRTRAVGGYRNGTHHEGPALKLTRTKSTCFFSDSLVSYTSHSLNTG